MASNVVEEIIVAATNRNEIKKLSKLFLPLNLRLKF